MKIPSQEHLEEMALSVVADAVDIALSDPDPERAEEALRLSLTAAENYAKIRALNTFQAVMN